MDDWVVYLVRCKDGSLYCGVTNNLEKRIATHNSGKGAKYTSPRLPVVLVVASETMSRSAALKLEYQVKQQRRDLKVAYLKQFG
ncbi:MAG: GIY-YIG nuclease family protein [Firmicutes bacterium]|nr:GIY-YIG nuclease family protein [Bacillota bacterium]